MMSLHLSIFGNKHMRGEERDLWQALWTEYVMRGYDVGPHGSILWSGVLVLQNMIQPTLISVQKTAILPSGQEKSARYNG